MTNGNDRISIQVGLSGYSFKIQADGNTSESGWMSPDRIFTTPELQKIYSRVDISVFTPKFALVPAQFHCPESSRQILEEVVSIDDSDVVEYVSVPEQGAVLVYSNSIGVTMPKVMSESVLMSDGSKARPLPEMFYMLEDMKAIPDYNRIMASYMDGVLYLLIAQGKTLLLANSFQAPDFTTAEYFLFLAMKKLQLNPEVSTIYFRTSLEADQEISLYRYFRNVEQI